ncbi:MAG TPA: hypothetical protein VN948_02325 [Terriglobales bacterium]|nr:hypothetical protein [Terriglobales bacterium]
MIDFTPQEMAEIETLTLTKKIARGLKGALTAKPYMADLFKNQENKDPIIPTFIIVFNVLQTAIPNSWTRSTNRT